MDLRDRLLAAVDDGMNCRSAASLFGVSPSTAVRLHAQRRDAGEFAAKRQGGDMRSRRVVERASDIPSVLDGRKGITLAELRLALAEMGLTVSVAGLHRFFARRGMMRKKDWPCYRAGPARRPEAAPALLRRPARSRS